MYFSHFVEFVIHKYIFIVKNDMNKFMNNDTG